MQAFDELSSGRALSEVDELSSGRVLSKVDELSSGRALSVLGNNWSKIILCALDICHWYSSGQGVAIVKHNSN